MVSAARMKDPGVVRVSEIEFEVGSYTDSRPSPVEKYAAPSASTPIERKPASASVEKTTSVVAASKARNVP